MFKLFSILFFCNSFKSIPPVDTSSYIVIRNVNIVDVIKDRIITHKTVIIKDSLISVIFGNNDNPAYPVNARIIDGTDKFLMPGLWDMHFHIAWDNSNDTALFELLLKYGITGIRDMGGSLTILNKFRKELKEKPGSYNSKLFHCDHTYLHIHKFG